MDKTVHAGDNIVGGGGWSEKHENITFPELVLTYWRKEKTDSIHHGMDYGGRSTFLGIHGTNRYY